MIEANPDLIKQNFAKISPFYDRANDAMTMGLLRPWRRKLVGASHAHNGHQVLDVATGTGDLALLFKQKIGDDGKVVALDLTPEMLEIGQAKARARGLTIDWQVGDAMNLPFTDQRFDICSIAFGIRNVQSPLNALKEMARVTRPGGQLLILETGLPRTKIWRGIYSAFMKTVIPRIGGWISGHPGPYRFLQESTFAFPCGEEFLNLMQSTGMLKDLHCESLLGGAAYLYQGKVT